MELKRLQLYQFRNYEKVDVRFAPRLNVLVGANGAGKTNFLEAVYLASRFKSFRTHSFPALAKEGIRSFSLKLDFRKYEKHPNKNKPPLTRGDLMRFEFTYFKGTKTLKLNEEVCTLAQVQGATPRVMLFTPSDTLLIQGSAAVRRAFMDRAIGELERDYYEQLETYHKALRSRNRQLKQRRKFNAWDEVLVRTGVTILKMREAFMQKLAKQASVVFEELFGIRHGAGNDSPQDLLGLSLAYTLRSWLPKNKKLEAPQALSDTKKIRKQASLTLSHKDYHRLLIAHEAHDKRRGYTVFGPHSDDIVVKLRGRVAQHYASQGESRTLAHALKLGVFKILEAEHGIRSILLLDDIFSDLDAVKLKNLMYWIQRHAQAILTCAQSQLLLPYTRSGEVFNVTAGGNIAVRT